MIAILLGAITYRIRGSDLLARWIDNLPLHHLISRGVFFIPMAALFQSWALAPALYLGILPSWWGELDFSKPGSHSWENWGKLLLRGAWTLIPTFGALALMDERIYWLLIAGAPMPIFYWIGQYIRKLPIMMTGAWEWGEFLYGAWLGAALSFLLS